MLLASKRVFRKNSCLGICIFQKECMEPQGSQNRQLGTSYTVLLPLLAFEAQCTHIIFEQIRKAQGAHFKNERLRRET